MMTQKFEAEERVMYLLRDSPIPTMDCICSTATRENEAFARISLPPVYKVFVVQQSFDQAILELEAAKFPVIRSRIGCLLVGKFEVWPFIATRSSQVQYPGNSLITIVHPRLPGHFFGL